MPLKVGGHNIEPSHQQRVDSVADIKARWEITDDDYDAICSSFQETLTEAGILGSRIQGRPTQSALKRAIERMLQKRSHRKVFQKLDSTIVQCDLRYLAQLLNTNYRRRMQRSRKREANRARENPPMQAAECSSRSKDQTLNHTIERRGRMTTDELGSSLSSPESVGHPTRRAIQMEKSNESKTCQVSPTFTTMMLIVRWQDEPESRIYRLQDLYAGPGPSDASEPEKLQYDVFMHILVDDLAFSPAHDLLIYDCVQEGRILVSNEKIWRAAIWDMFNQSQRYFKFQLQRRRRSDG